MKIFTYVIMIIALGLLIFNGTKLEFEALLEGDSAVAAIGMLSSACVILLMVILQMSLKIKNRK